MVEHQKDTKGRKTPALGRLQVRRVEARRLLGGIAERTFATLEQEGVIVPAKRGRGGRPSIYDLTTIVPAYLAHISGQRPANDRDARARRDLAVAELNELRVQKERGDLLPRHVVIAEGQAYTKAWTAKVRHWPRRARQEGFITTPDQEAGLTMLCRELMGEISGWKTLADVSAVVDSDEESAE